MFLILDPALFGEKFYRSVHEGETTIPLAVAKALADDSWHNDACDSFVDPAVRAVPAEGGRDGYYPKLWVEAVDPDNREGTFIGRFLVTGGDEHEYGHEHVYYEGDDASKAMRALRAASTEYLRRFGTGEGR